MRHMKTHTGEKPFKCDMCPYSAADKSTLMHHMRTHTGEKPFKCDVCPYSTSQKGHLMRHVKTCVLIPLHRRVL